jgi:hypothetical protein
VRDAVQVLLQAQVLPVQVPQVPVPRRRGGVLRE